jgi:hypothetical protein
LWVLDSAVVGEGENSGNVARGDVHGEEGADLEIQGHRRFPGLHLGDPRLARLDSSGQIRLSEAETLPCLPDQTTEAQPEVDVELFLLAQIEKVGSVPELPACLYEPLASISCLRTGLVAKTSVL